MSVKKDSKGLLAEEIRDKVFKNTLFYSSDVNPNNARAAVDEINQKVVPRLKELGLFKEEEVQVPLEPVPSVPDEEDEEE